MWCCVYVNMLLETVMRESMLHIIMKLFVIL